MKYFLHTPSNVRIISGEDEYNVSPVRFAELEPAYPGLPEGVVVRYWTPERAYFDVGEYDGHDCGQYCDNIGTYTTYPEIFAAVSLSKDSIRADAPDSITFTATLQDADSNTIPLSYSWFVRLTHEDEGDIDRVLLDFVDGTCEKVYTFLSGNPLGTWLLDESKFELVDINGTLYRVRLLDPVLFVAYRELT